MEQSDSTGAVWSCCQVIKSSQFFGPISLAGPQTRAPHSSVPDQRTRATVSTIRVIPRKHHFPFGGAGRVRSNCELLNFRKLTNFVKYHHFNLSSVNHQNFKKYDQQTVKSYSYMRCENQRQCWSTRSLSMALQFFCRVNNSDSVVLRVACLLSYSIFGQ